MDRVEKGMEACMALMDPDYKEEIEVQGIREYLEQFHQCRELFIVHFCKDDDGVRVE